jgi:hypothetical protein
MPLLVGNVILVALALTLNNIPKKCHYRKNGFNTSPTIYCILLYTTTKIFILYLFYVFIYFLWVFLMFYNFSFLFFSLFFLFFFFLSKILFTKMVFHLLEVDYHLEPLIKTSHESLIGSRQRGQTKLFPCCSIATHSLHTQRCG